MIAERIGEILRRLQWPIAYGVLAMSPLFAVETIQWLFRSLDYPVYATMFWLGFFGVFFVFRTRKPSNPWLLAWIARERRLSHAIVTTIFFKGGGHAASWLKRTLGDWFQRFSAGKNALGTTKPKGTFRDGESLDIGGIEGIDGRGVSSSSNENTMSFDVNWLRSASPFFLPSAPMLLWLLSALVLPASLRCLTLGVGIAYHLLSVYVELCEIPPHELGFTRRFAWCFIIPMNIAVFGITYAFALKGFSGIPCFLLELGHPLRTLRGWFGWSETT